MPVLVRYRRPGSAAWGVIDGDRVRTVEGSIYGRWRAGGDAGRVDALELLPPCEPRTVVALAYNYKDLVGRRETYDEPLIFLKSVTGVIADPQPIRVPAGFDRVWVEVEVAFVVRQEASHVPVSQARDYILGYTVGNDVTAVNVHGRDHHLARSKALDTFCPVHTRLSTEVADGPRRLTTTINGRLTQDGTTANRILNDDETLSLVSRFITLQPGDLVLTGTPAGAMDSLVKPGDDAVLEIEGLGRLRTAVVAGA